MTIDAKAAARLAALKTMLDHVRDTFKLGFGFHLWDGTLVPASHPPQALAVSIADEGAVPG